MDEDVELEVKINCAGNEARHAASVSEWRASSGAIEPARTAVCMEGREGPESDLHLIHKKKRDWSGSPPPSLPPEKRKDSHLLEQRLPILSSANLQHSEDLCQSGNRRQSEGKTFSQSGYNKGNITALSRNTSNTHKRLKRTLEGGSSECPSKTFRSGQEDIKWPLHRLSVPANIHGGARQSFQVQPNMSHGASLSGLPVAGTGVPNSFLAPVAPFYHSCTLTTTSGNMNTSVPVGRPLQGNNVWPNFAQSQPTVPYCQAQSVIPPTHNPLPFNQPVNVRNLETRFISTGLIKPTTAPAEPSKNQPAALRQKKEDVQKVPNLTGFVEEDMNKDHLDWHFKQNRSKKVIRLTDKHREWHYSVQSCEVCGEQFDMAWDDEREQWSLKNAIRFDNKTYHPSCYEDFTKVM
ncbi:hypothetical protein AGOR_G00125730 [Albula goreensis]|uniref:Uncharacterized protein n=1 Tax=Albula goreensis TaxID=1534307 RepID=A0A8T3DD00_9TELE|nr:hypothetical protein AGOR_G00125730 [Albula goreensis]